MNLSSAKKYLPLVIVIVLVLLLLQTDFAFAQCPMCRAAAESNIKEGGKHALGLNTGILYLFITPYLIVATLGFLWWRNNYKATAQEQIINNEHNGG